MTISRTIYTGFSSEEREFDINEFVMSILLFDNVLASSPGIIPSVVRVIGKAGLFRLVEEGRLSVVGGGPSAQATLDYKNPGFFANRPNKPLQFGFETIFVDPNDPKNHSVEDRLLIDLMREKDGYSLSKADAKEISCRLLPSLRVIDGKTLNYGHEIHDDVKNKQELVSGLLLSGLARTHGLPVFVMNVKLTIEEVSKNVFQINTNLGKLLNKNVNEIHELLKKPFFEITGTNLQLLRMKAVDAAAGLTEAQSRIISKRVDYLSKLLSRSDTRPEFTRVCSITNTPRLPDGHSINIDQLIDLRESPEAHAFRDWLQSSKKYTDEDIKQITSNWKRRIGELLSTENVKGIRWLTSTGAGVLIGDATGAIINGLDYFLDKFFPTMGPIGFITVEFNKFIQKQKKM